METINLDDVTIPTPAAYAADNPAMQMENLCYVILQILTSMKAAGITFTASGEVAAAITDFSSSVLAVAEMERDYGM